MILPSAAAEPVTIDAALLALIPIVTVVLTIVAGLVGAWIQGRREHNRWLREQRYTAFVETIAALDSLDAHTSGMQDGGSFQRMHLETMPGAEAQKRYLIEESVRRMDRFYEAVPPIRLLGPDNVRLALVAAQEAFKANDTDAQKAARSRAIDLMRKSLKVKA